MIHAGFSLGELIRDKDGISAAAGAHPLAYIQNRLTIRKQEVSIGSD